MKHKKDAIELAEKVIKLHMESGLSEEDAKQASIVTIKYAVNSGLYPFCDSVNKRAYNYLKGEPFPNSWRKEE